MRRCQCAEASADAADMWRRHATADCHAPKAAAAATFLQRYAAVAWKALRTACSFVYTFHLSQPMLGLSNYLQDGVKPDAFHGSMRRICILLVKG